MITESDLMEIAAQLLVKSRSNEVAWQRGTKFGFTDDALVVSFPKSFLLLTYGTPETEPDFIRMELRNTDGVRVATVVGEAGDDKWSLLKLLRDEAFRIATGWDAVLSDVRNEVLRNGKIGL
jgi:hypothetical protein